MPPVMPLDTPLNLARRSAAIRLPKTLFAVLAGVDQNTVARALSGRGQVATRDKLERALVAEELRLRDYLIALHGTRRRERAA